MRLKTVQSKVLRFLHKNSPVNTFKLSRALNIDRIKLIDTINELQREGLIEFRTGMVRKVKKKQKESKKIIQKEKVSLPKPTIAEIPKKPELKMIEQKIIKEALPEPEFKTKIQNVQKLKKEIKDLQSQRETMAQKLTEEKKILGRLQKERKEKEKLTKEQIEAIEQKIAESHKYKTAEDFIRNLIKGTIKLTEEQINAIEKKIEESKVKRKTVEDYLGEIGKEAKKTKKFEKQKPAEKEKKLKTTIKKKLKQKKINKEFIRLEKKTKEKLKKKKELKKVKIVKKKIQKKPKKIKRKRLVKEHPELDSWLKQRKLEMEKLKLEIRLLGSSASAEDVRKIRDSVEKLREMIRYKINGIRK